MGRSLRDRRVHQRGNAVRAVRWYYGKLPAIDHEELRSLWRERHELLWRQSQEAVSSGQPGTVRAGGRGSPERQPARRPG